MSKVTVVISAFPACGKSYTFNNFNGKPFTILDSDSSKYSWIYENGVKTDKRNPNFIEDYISHIKENIGKVDVIFVSSHVDVRKALEENKINYFLVYPTLDMKEEMLRRMKERGNDEKFIKFQEEHFDEFVSDVEKSFDEWVKNTPYDNGKRHCPYHLVPLTKNQPYIDNKMIDFLLDNCMGNLSCLWWNYG